MTLGVNVSIRLVPVNEIINLRHAVLRQGLPGSRRSSKKIRPPGRSHLGAFVKDSLIGCVTLHPSQWKDEPAWQVRGMACRADWQNRGIGRRLIESAERRLLNGNGPRLLSVQRPGASGWVLSEAGMGRHVRGV